MFLEMTEQEWSGITGHERSGAHRSYAVMKGVTSAVLGICLSLLLVLMILTRPARQHDELLLQVDREGAEHRLYRLHQRLSGSGERTPGDANTDVREALIRLENSLQRELSSVKTVVKQLENSGGTRVEKEGAHTALEKADDDASWRRRTMQRGALRGENVDSQLQKALEHVLEKKLSEQTHWSNEDLVAALKLADYIRQHPLPKSDEGSVQKITFQRKEMSQDEYKSLVDALRKAVSEERVSSQDYDESSETVSDRSQPHETDHHSSESRFIPQERARSVGYTVQPGDMAIRLAQTKGRRWVDHEIMREHGEFVRLFHGGYGIPLAVRPYWA